MSSGTGPGSRLYVLLLRLLPREFRRGLGDQMALTFDERHALARGRGRLAVAWLWAREFGAVMATALRARFSGSSPVGGVGQDVRFAARGLLHAPGFTFTSIFALALGIGATTAIFSVVYGILGDLPYPAGDRIALVYEDQRGDGTGTMALSGQEYLALRGAEDVFDGVTAYQYYIAVIRGEPYPEQVGGVQIAHDFIDFLGTRVLHGRDFTESDQPDDAGVVIGYELWQRRWLGDPSLVGRTITINDQPHVVLGISQSDFTYFNDTNQVFFLLDPGEPSAPHTRHALYVLARPRAELSASEANERAAAVVAGVAADDVHTAESPRPAYLFSLYEAWVGSVRGELLLLLGAVALVLLIACANVGNLLVARGMDRRQEIGIRLAIGGGRWRVLRQLMTESALLSLLGGVAGVGLAAACVRGFGELVANVLPRGDDVTIDLGVLAFTTVVAMVAGVVSGMAPAWFISRADPGSVMGSTGAAMTRSRGGRRMGSAFLVVQVALALTLVVGAALVVRSFLYLQTRDLGFEPDGVVTGRVGLGRGERYDTADETGAFFATLFERLRATPGVMSVGFTTLPPGFGAEISGSIVVDGAESGAAPVAIGYCIITAGTVETLQMTLLRGRDFTEFDDAPGAPAVALVSDALARQQWPNSDPIGQRIRMDREGADWITVVGVVGDVEKSVLGGPTLPGVYLSAGQAPPRGGFVLARTAGEPAPVVAALRDIVGELDDQIPVAGLGTLEAVIAGTIGRQRLTTILFAGFGVVALLLATIGQYAVFQHFVRQRTAEIGIRVALGARPANVVSLVVRHATVIAIAGIALGLALALAASRLIETLLHGVQPIEAPTYLTVAVLLVAVAWLASLLPARLAASVDPVRALKR